MFGTKSLGDKYLRAFYLQPPNPLERGQSGFEPPTPLTNKKAEDLFKSSALSVIRLGLGVLVHPVGVMFTILPNPPLKRRAFPGFEPQYI